MGNTNDVQTMMLELERLKAENAALIAKTTRPLKVAVSEKGAVSIYGLSRFPVSLYRDQWAKVFGMKATIEKFIADNATTITEREAITKANKVNGVPTQE